MSALMIINPSESGRSARGVCAAMETQKPALCFYGNGPEARAHLGNVHSLQLLTKFLS